MRCRVVRFASSRAVEVLDAITRSTVLYRCAALCGQQDALPAVPQQAGSSYVDYFLRYCAQAIRAVAPCCSHVVLCQSLDLVHPAQAGFREALARVLPLDAPLAWVIDARDWRVFAVSLPFAQPIFRGSVLCGNVLPRPDGSFVFDARELPSWCGAASARTRPRWWLFQQLNVCLTNATGSWFDPMRPHPFAIHNSLLSDTFSGNVALTEEWLAVPETRNGYAHHVTVSMDGMLPLFDRAFQRWTDAHRFTELRTFQLARTQYPYVYALLPDRVNHANALRKKLQRSDAPLRPLLASVLTLSAERAVAAWFRPDPGGSGYPLKYRRVWCARYDHVSASHSYWVPVCPVYCPNNE